jgi:16S rRNA C1402 (ribose-2'-O) methylase RsmI
MFEEVKTDTLAQLLQYYTATPARGEIVVVVAGATLKNKD